MFAIDVRPDEIIMEHAPTIYPAVEGWEPYDWPIRGQKLGISHTTGRPTTGLHASHNMDSAGTGPHFAYYDGDATLEDIMSHGKWATRGNTWAHYFNFLFGRAPSH